MSMVVVSISLYIFMYRDLNDTVEHAHEIEIESVQGEKEKMKRLFDQTATAFVSAVEKRDDYATGNAVKTAVYARKIAERLGKDKDFCESVYYTALLHDVGMIGIPDSVIKSAAEFGEWDYETIRKKPEIAREILSSITEYPYLAQGAYYCHERYDGKGYPEGLTGEAIPEIARIVAVADAYVAMTTKRRYRDTMPYFLAREEFLKGAGEAFDPTFADVMVKIIDSDSNEKAEESEGIFEKEIICTGYREQISTGISVERAVKLISFDFEKVSDDNQSFSAPSIVLFDSYDGRTHDNEKAIEAYNYTEYGEVWFDKYSITTEARKIEEKIIKDEADPESEANRSHFEILAGRYEDHLKLSLKTEGYEKEVIVALSGGSRSAFIGLTGENGRLYNILINPTGDKMDIEDIPRIVKSVSYIDHLESDIPNLQIDRNRSASTQGVEIKGRMRLLFHTMSLPGASLVWNCPYILLYYSEDGAVGGPDYKEFNMIKLNGEDQGDNEYAHNRFILKKKEDFPGWDAFNQTNKKGLECEVAIEKRGNQILLKTENLGISIENTTSFKVEQPKVFVALTGDQIALTDIRIG